MTLPVAVSAQSVVPAAGGNITITGATYKKATSKFTITASDNVISQALKIKCTDDAINPSTGLPFTGTMGGLLGGKYSLVFVGGQPPTFVTCTSNMGASVTYRQIIVQ